MDHLTLASASSVTQSTAVGGSDTIYSDGRLKTTCSFALSSTPGAPLGKVYFLHFEECQQKDQYALEFQVEKNHTRLAVLMP